MKKTSEQKGEQPTVQKKQATIAHIHACCTHCGLQCITSSINRLFAAAEIYRNTKINQSERCFLCVERWIFQFQEFTVVCDSVKQNRKPTIWYECAYCRLFRLFSLCTKPIVWLCAVERQKQMT